MAVVLTIYKQVKQCSLGLNQTKSTFLAHYDFPSPHHPPLDLRGCVEREQHARRLEKKGVRFRARFLFGVFSFSSYLGVSDKF